MTRGLLVLVLALWGTSVQVAPPRASDLGMGAEDRELSHLIGQIPEATSSGT